MELHSMPSGRRPQRPSATAQAVTARDVGLELTRRLNRWLIGGAVAATAALSLVAAHAFHGHTATVGGVSASASGTAQQQSSSNADGAGLQSPAQGPVPAASAPSGVVSGGS
jgi:hypothetical protein